MARRKPRSIVYGKVCEKHPEFEGKRSGSRGACVGCAKERMSRYRSNNPNFSSDYYHANKEQQNATTKAWRERNSDRVKETSKTHYLKNRQWHLNYSKEYRSRFPEKHKAASAAWYQANKHRNNEFYQKRKDYLIAANKEWRAKNKKAVSAYARNQEVLRKRVIGAQALSKAYTKEIHDIYKNCPAGCHVDHIVPLRGKSVNGLHVPWNLQYLPAIENIKKGNRHDGA